MNAGEIVRFAAGWLVDYLRWTQVVPMIIAWLLVLLLLVGTSLVNFQQQAFTLLDSLLLWWSSQSWLPQPPESGQTIDNDHIQIGLQTLKSWALRIWLGLSVVLFLWGFLRQHSSKPPPPPRFKRQILIVSVAAGLVFIAFILNYLFGSETFNGSRAQWMFSFAAFAFLPWLVSLYSLTANYILGQISNALLKDPENWKDQTGGEIAG